VSFELIKEYRKIQPFSFKFKPDLNVIVGENGSGKSSLLHLITNLQQNKDVCKAEYTLGDYSFLDTEKQNPRTKSLNDQQETFDFAVNARYVSHGEAMLFLLDYAKKLKDTVIIVDEPESGLSLFNQKKIFESFRNGCQVIIATHSYVMIKLAKEVFCMDTKLWSSSIDYLKDKT